MPVPLVGTGDNNRPIQTRAYLCRTNASLLKQMFDFADSFNSMTIEGGLDYILTYENKITMDDLLEFIYGSRTNVKNAFLRNNFQNVTELKDYASDADDTLLTNILKFVTDHTETAIKQGIAKVRRKLVPYQSDATFSTVHKAKGKEWDHVTIINDFTLLPPTIKRFKEGNDGKIESLTEIEIQQQIAVLNEEINLLYVALTRGRVQVNHSFDFLKQQGETDKKENLSLAAVEMRLADGDIDDSDDIDRI